MDQQAAPIDPDAPRSGIDPIDLLSDPALDMVFLRPARAGVGSAWHGHVPFAHWLVGALRPRSIVELGTHNGVSYSAFCEAALRLGIGARAAAIDTWRGDEHAGRYGDEVYEEFRAFHDPRYGGFSETMRMTFDEARPFFADASIDLLHIDGLHTYEAVRHDWESWRSALGARAVVLFHDINEHVGNFGVWRLWEELRLAHPSFTFLHAHGLGVLCVGAEVPASVLALCAHGDASPETGRIRERFAHLGERWDAHSEHVLALSARRVAEAGIASRDRQLDQVRRRLDDTRTEAEAAMRLAEEQAQLIRAEVDDDRRERRRLEDEVDALRETAARSRERQAELSDECARLRAEIGSAHAGLATRASEWERIHGVLMSTMAERDALSRHLEEIPGAASWAIAAPMRRLERAVPRLERAGRRAVLAARLAVGGSLVAHLGRRSAMRADIETLRRSGLLDDSFYRACHPGLEASGRDPAEHYVRQGAREGSLPNPAFDTAWYRARRPDLAGSDENPLLHWLRVGRADGAASSPLFDRDWYVGRHPDAAPDPLAHWVAHAREPGIDPNPMFDAVAYLSDHPDAASSGLGALGHWVRTGMRAGHRPHPLFDPSWYRAQHGLGSGDDPLAHWLRRRTGPVSAAMDRAQAVPLAPISFPEAASPTVSIVVPAWRHASETLRCLACLAWSGMGAGVEILVADDDPTARITPFLAARVNGVSLHENATNLGFLLSCNEAARRARGAVLVFLNNDTEVHPGWLAPIVSLLERRPDAGMVGVKLLEADGTIQEAGGAMTRDGWGVPYGRGGAPDDPDFDFVREVDVVIGACFAVRRQLWEAIGGFDARYAPAYYEEFDLAFEVRARGMKVLYQPDSVVDHLGSNSYGAETRDLQSVRNHARFCRKWAQTLHRELPADRSDELRLRARPRDNRTVLVLEDQVPEWDRHAGAVSTRQYLSLWQEMGFHVVFAPVLDRSPTEPYATTLRQDGIEVLCAPHRLRDWLERNGRFLHVIWAARPDVTGPLLDLLRRTSHATIVYFPHDMHHLRERARYELDGDPRAKSEADRFLRLERRIFASVDRVLAISDEEADAIRALAPDADVHRVPPYLHPAPPPPPTAAAFAARDAVLFVGGYAHLPNVDAALFLACEIMPLVWREEPEIRVILAGSSPPAELRSLRSPRIEVPGFMPDLAPVEARARLSVDPIRYGAGVKGKIVAALWTGIPVVTTAVGNEGIGIVDGRDGLLAESAEAFARAIVSHWRDPERLALLARAGQEIVARRFVAHAARSTLSRVVAAGRRERPDGH